MGVRGLWVCLVLLGLQRDHQKWEKKKNRFQPAPAPCAVWHGIFCVLSGFQLLQKWAGDRAPQSWATWVFRPHLASPELCQRQHAYVRPKDSDTTEQRCRQSALIHCVPSWDPFPFPGLNRLVNRMGTHMHTWSSGR